MHSQHHAHTLKISSSTCVCWGGRGGGSHIKVEEEVFRSSLTCNILVNNFQRFYDLWWICIDCFWILSWTIFNLVRALDILCGIFYVVSAPREKKRRGKGERTYDLESSVSMCGLMTCKNIQTHTQTNTRHTHRHTQTRTRTRTHNQQTHIHTHTHTHTSTHARTPAHTHTYTYMHTHTHTHICVQSVSNNMEK